MTTMNDEMQEKDEIRSAFAPLRDQLRALEDGLNPGDDNLHFATTTTAQLNDFEVLGRIGTEALDLTRRHWEFFRDNPYAGDMFWYNFLLLASAAARSRLGPKVREPVADDAIERLLSIILDISECMLMGCDSSIRCGEAIGNILLAFPQETLRDQVKGRIMTAPYPGAASFLESVLGRVNTVEKQDDDLP